MPDLNNEGISLLSTTNLPLNAVAATTVYTVPANTRLVIDHAKLIAGADAGASALTIGKSTALTDFLGTQTVSNLDAQYDMVILKPVPNATPVKCKSYAAGDIIQVDVTTGSGGATNKFMLFGTLYAA